MFGTSSRGRGCFFCLDAKTGKTLWEGDEQLLSSTEAEYHKQALERYGEFFEGVHDPENFELNLFEGPIFAEDYYTDTAKAAMAEAMSPDAARESLEAEARSKQES